MASLFRHIAQYLTYHGTVLASSDDEYFSATSYLPEKFRSDTQDVAVYAVPSERVTFPFLVFGGGDFRVIIYAESGDFLRSFFLPFTEFMVGDEPLLFNYEYREGAENGLSCEERMRVVQEFTAKHQ